MREQSEMLVGPSKGERTRVFGHAIFHPLFCLSPTPNCALRRVLAACFRRRMADYERLYEIENPHQRLGAGGDLLRSNVDFNAVRVRDGADVIACGVKSSKQK